MSRINGTQNIVFPYTLQNFSFFSFMLCYHICWWNKVVYIALGESCKDPILYENVNELTNLCFKLNNVCSITFDSETNVTIIFIHRFSNRPVANGQQGKLNYGLKLPKCWLQFKKIFYWNESVPTIIINFIIIFGTLSFPITLTVNPSHKFITLTPTLNPNF